LFFIIINLQNTTGRTDQEMEELIMMTINNTYKFDKQMKRFKKHTKMVIANEINNGYLMTGSDERFDFLDYRNYNPNILCRPAEFIQNVLLENFFLDNPPRAIYYVEAWRGDEDKEYYISLKKTKDDGNTMVFEIWHYYEVATVELTLIRDPYGDFPKLIKLQTLEHVAHYVDSNEEIA